MHTHDANIDIDTNEHARARARARSFACDETARDSGILAEIMLYKLCALRNAFRIIQVAGEKDYFNNNIHFKEELALRVYKHDGDGRPLDDYQYSLQKFVSVSCAIA